MILIIMYNKLYEMYIIIYTKINIIYTMTSNVYIIFYIYFGDIGCEYWKP